MIQTIVRNAAENVGVTIRVARDMLTIDAFIQTRLGLCGYL